MPRWPSAWEQVACSRGVGCQFVLFSQILSSVAAEVASGRVVRMSIRASVMGALTKCSHVVMSQPASRRANDEGFDQCSDPGLSVIRTGLSSWSNRARKSARRVRKNPPGAGVSRTGLSLVGLSQGRLGRPKTSVENMLTIPSTSKGRRGLDNPLERR